MARGAAIVVRVALGVSSWKGRRRLWGGVLDSRATGRLGTACGASWWTSIRSGSRTVWFSSTVGAASGARGGGRSGQSRLLAECASPQLEHLPGEARQHPSMALRFLPLGHEGLGQGSSALVCWREHSGHVGVSALYSSLTRHTSNTSGTG